MLFVDNITPPMINFVETKNKKYQKVIKNILQIYQVESIDNETALMIDLCEHQSSKEKQNKEPLKF